jgi:hypothetical protein
VARPQCKPLGCTPDALAADPRELVLKWSAFLATAERGTYFATYRGSFVGPEPALEDNDALAA